MVKKSKIELFPDMSGDDFIKIGTLRTEHKLFVRLRNTKVWLPVILCKEKDMRYIFIDPCPICGKFHIHGIGYGARVPHCNENVLEFMKKNKYINTAGYVLANEEEYRYAWRRAKQIND